MINDVHRQQVLFAQESERPLTIKTHTLLPEAQGYIDRVLQVYLEELGLPGVFDKLSFCVRELALNAKKANTKRVYFETRRLNPQDPQEYRRGMVAFKRDTLDDQHVYQSLLKEKGLYIKIEFLKRDNVCSVAIRNNVEIFPAELARVRDKIAKAQRYTRLEDALNEILDESEGAGLGLLVLILMLKQMGLEGDFFHFYSVGGETVARIILPLAV